ncbi:hypothetical protein HLK59_34045 [Streptomyces sp. S3(2020)]|uniref:hypothetical protein n=1 Tax=Streptomyces sp. S3(2020) TaxID=2732044 RepID=UPI001489E8CB|nr:hypothetical protein [Streptomyces sp. S3(2020)]NNN35303.1 hypothetical protein [Streptomyces sp. S3(2020)]
MRRRVPAVAFAFAACLPLLLGGCGIQETDVIEAGGPASVQAFFDGESEMLLFFRSPDGGLTPVIRDAGATIVNSDGTITTTAGDQAAAPPVTTQKAVTALLAGLQDEDRAAGLSTALPAAHPKGTIKVERTSPGRVTTRVPLALAGLNDTALRQLTCTIAYSQDTDGQVVVDIEGRDGTASSGTCGLAAGSSANAPAATPTG